MEEQDQQNQEAINASQSYLSFEELTINEKVFSCEELKLQLSTSTDWKCQFTCLDTLRSINKFQNKEFLHKILPKVLQEILVLVDSIRSNLMKNSLMLLEEIIGHSSSISEISNDLIALIVRKIVEKGINDKQFIKTQAKAAILSLQNKPDSLSSGVVISLSELVQDKNPSIQELAMQTLSVIVINSQNRIQLLDNESYNILIQVIAKSLNGKRMQVKKLAKDVGQAIIKAKGQTAFNSLGIELETQVLAILSENKQEQKGSFKDFLAQKKKGDGN